MRSYLLVAFRIIYAMAAALLLIAAGLIIGSHFMVESGSPPGRFLAISIAVGGTFLACCLLVLGIRSRILKIAEMPYQNGASSGLDRHVSALLVYLILGGAGFCAIMMLVTFAILSRINEGFAVFG